MLGEQLHDGGWNCKAISGSARSSFNLLGEQLHDGGWNCKAISGSARSSFNTTICVLEALLAHEQAAGVNPKVTQPCLRGQGYPLERRLFRRRSTGEVIAHDAKDDAAWTCFAFPAR